MTSARQQWCQSIGEGAQLISCAYQFLPRHELSSIILEGYGGVIEGQIKLTSIKAHPGDVCKSTDQQTRLRSPISKMDTLNRPFRATIQMLKMGDLSLKRGYSVNP